MDFELDPRHAELQAIAKEFAETSLMPRAAEVDATAEYPWDHVHAAADLGLFGLSIPAEYGGDDVGALGFCIVLEEVARGCASTATILMAYVLGVLPLVNFGSPAQKARYLPEIASGTKGVCLAITEAHAGSDAAAIRCTARREGDGWALNGVKSLIGNVGPAELCIVAARSGGPGHKGISTFLLEKGTPGLRVGEIVEKMSVRGTVTGELIMENVKVPADALLGAEGSGFRTVMTSLDMTRLAAGAEAVGIAQAAYEEAVRYAQTRTAFGRTLAEHQAIAFKIADMATRIHAARLMLHHACTLFDSGRPYRKEVAMVKVYAAETATWVTHTAQQIFGGWGLLKGQAVERLYRDARVTELYAGTSEIQRLIVSRQVLEAGA